MFLRRFAQHLRKQDWTAIVIELVIVAIGVFLGLQVQNWNQARLERNAAIAYHGRIIEEIHRNEHNLEARRRYYERVREHAQATFDALQGSTEPLGAPFLVDAYSATQRWNLEVDRAVYDEILGTGQVDVLLDVETRRLLSNYFVVFESILLTISDDVTYRNLVRSHLPIAVQRRIEAVSGDVVAQDESGAVVVTLRSELPDWSPSEIAEGLRSLTGSAELLQSLTLRLSDLDTKLTVLGRHSERTRTLARYLESHAP